MLINVELKVEKAASLLSTLNPCDTIYVVNDEELLAALKVKYPFRSVNLCALKDIAKIKDSVLSESSGAVTFVYNNAETEYITRFSK